MSNYINLNATTKTVNIADIKITKPFRKTIPADSKIAQRVKEYQKTGTFTNVIVISQDGFLLDGYTQYLICKTFNIPTVKAVVIKCKMVEKEPIEKAHEQKIIITNLQKFLEEIRSYNHYCFLSLCTLNDDKEQAVDSTIRSKSLQRFDIDETGYFIIFLDDGSQIWSNEPIRYVEREESNENVYYKLILRNSKESFTIGASNE